MMREIVGYVFVTGFTLWGLYAAWLCLIMLLLPRGGDE